MIHPGNMIHAMGNMICAINMWALPVVRYPAGMVDWKVNELHEADRKTWKLMAIHGVFNRHGDIDRLYVSRNEGGKGLIQIEQVVCEEEAAMVDYVH